MTDTPAEAQLLRIYLGENARHAGRPLYEAIVEAAHAHGLAGATVLHGILGYGSSGEVHSAKIFRLSEDLPLVVEIVDNPAAIAAFLPVLDGLLTQGLVTLEPVRIVLRRPKPDPSAG